MEPTPQDRKKMARIPLALAVFALALPALPAHAQNAGQIARVQGGASCPGCNLFQADLAGAEIPGVDVSGARLRQSDLSYSIMDGVNFSGADLSIAEAYAGRFTRANFSNADLSEASFVGAYLGSANFAGANLAGSILSGANLEGARNLTQRQLDQACGDAETTLPPGLRAPVCY
jgi:uncharacterized protein YjbI with pentapeptide repeats